MDNKVNGRIYVEHNVKDNDVRVIEPRRLMVGYGKCTKSSTK